MRREIRRIETLGFVIGAAVTLAACFSSNPVAPILEDGSIPDAALREDASVPEAGTVAPDGGEIVEPDASTIPDSSVEPDASPDASTAPEGGVDAGGSCIGSAGCSCHGGGAGVSNCGPSGTESCCASVAVPGGTFYRSYDGAAYPSMAYPATVSAFQLDKYEVTVGRFRAFVAVADTPWAPEMSDGRHTYLNGGKGLAMGGPGGADSSIPYELGWFSAYDGVFPEQISTWSAGLTRTNGTWTASPGANENLPINNVTWYEAFAFCVYDGGFLPSEAEWNFAAAGGSDQRPYPWGAAAPGADTSHAIYGCHYDANDAGTCSVVNIAPVGSVPAGNGKYGNADMAGNVSEFVIDESDATYLNPCVDCADITPGNFRSIRGGNYESVVANIAVGYRDSAQYQSLFENVGFRCAHAP
jgi:formylglycine-generating enzyme required for sulfatase activity